MGYVDLECMCMHGLPFYIDHPVAPVICMVQSLYLSSISQLLNIHRKNFYYRIVGKFGKEKVW